MIEEHEHQILAQAQWFCRRGIGSRFGGGRGRRFGLQEFKTRGQFARMRPSGVAAPTWSSVMNADMETPKLQVETALNQACFESFMSVDSVDAGYLVWTTPKVNQPPEP